MISAHGARARSWTVPIGTKHQEPKHPFGLPQGSPAQPSCAAVRHAPGVERARKKQSDRKSAACSHCAQALPVGQELDIGQFPLLRHSMRPSVIKRAPCIERDRKKLNKRKRAACSQRARGRTSHGQIPLGSTRAHFPELAPLRLDSGTRGYNPRCRDTVDLPPPSPRGSRGVSSGGKSQYMAEPARARHGRRDPGRGWALRVFIKTPAPLPCPSAPPAPGPGPGPLCVPHPYWSYVLGGGTSGVP
jgi:hypothetical protein